MHDFLRLVVLVAVPSLVGPTVAERKQAAVAWSTTHGAVMDERRARLDGGLECFTARAPAPARCERALELCATKESGGFPGDSWGSTLELSLGDGAPSLPLHVRAGSGVDERTCEGTTFQNSPPPTRAQAQAAQRAFKACMKAEQARLDRLSTDYRCTLLAINPCLSEAYLSCTGRKEGEPVRGTFWFSFAPDAGDFGVWEKGAPDFVDQSAE
ncbi:MAG: hypothetical protein Q8L14_13090 [Myxococcales bacterium]|nr:hypothetical protein [Myxococcales bacterium]